MSMNIENQICEHTGEPLGKQLLNSEGTTSRSLSRIQTGEKTTGEHDTALAAESELYHYDCKKV